MWTGFVYCALSLFWWPQTTSMMELFNIPWATANKGILTKRYILFVYVEGNTALLCGYICTLFASLEARIVEKKNCDRRLGNIARGRKPRAAFSISRSQSFATRTEIKLINNLFFFLPLSHITFIVVERFHAHIASTLMWLCLRDRTENLERFEKW